MITMSHGNQDYVFHDGYNLVELPPGEHIQTSDDAGPYVLATLRNVFSESQNEEYEYIVEGGAGREAESAPFHREFEDGRHDGHQDHDIEEEDDDEDDDTKKEFPCTECSKVYTSERRLKHHIMMHKNKEAFKCPTCGFCYQSPDSLRRHIRKVAACNPEFQNAGQPPSVAP